jgi:hypothetical protein
MSMDAMVRDIRNRFMSCDLPLRLLDAAGVRNDDVLSLTGQTGRLIQVHPVAFHQTLDMRDVAGWQARQNLPAPALQQGRRRHADAAPACSAPAVDQGSSLPKVNWTAVSRAAAVQRSVACCRSRSTWLD